MGRTKSTKVVLDREILQSKAFWSLTEKWAPQVMLIFLGKRRMVEDGPKGRKRWVVDNNGEIEFTYKEAESKYGLTNRAFSKALRSLHAKGFIDVAKLGGAYRGIRTLYSVSSRWRDYGTSQFEEQKWPADDVQRGYRSPKSRRVVTA